MNNSTAQTIIYRVAGKTDIQHAKDIYATIRSDVSVGHSTALNATYAALDAIFATYPGTYAGSPTLVRELAKYAADNFHGVKIQSN